MRTASDLPVKQFVGVGVGSADLSSPSRLTYVPLFPLSFPSSSSSTSSFVVIVVVVVLFLLFLLFFFVFTLLSPRSQGRLLQTSLSLSSSSSSVPSLLLSSPTASNFAAPFPATLLSARPAKASLPQAPTPSSPPLPPFSMIPPSRDQRASSSARRD